MVLILGLLSSYLIGAIPTAYIFGRLIKGIDIRKHGSGNVGATNAFRVLGPPIGITVLLLDAVKGVLPVVFIADIVFKQGVGLSNVLLMVLFGMVAVLGHSFTVFLNFKGGKGMATTLGVLIGLSIKLPAVGLILILELAAWVIIFLLGRIVSLASIIAAILIPVLFMVFKQSFVLVVMSLFLSVFVVIRHKSNISRLLQGKEPRLNFHKPK